MKVAIIGDMHFNVKNGNKTFQKNIKQFCDNVLFPYLFENKINTVLQSGDLFDSRTSTHSEGLKNSKDCFFNKLKDNNIDLHLILGNHCIFRRESLEINTPELVLAEYDNITIHKNPTVVKFDNVTVDFLSWICDENREATFEFIKNSKSDYCFAHLELAGFKMSKYYVAEHGDDPNLFNKYKQVWSGHFHSKSQSKNILYLGNPTQDDWSSVDEVKGFHVFDTETKTLEFIENPYNLYERIVYNDSKEQDNLVKRFKDKYVRVVIERIDDDKIFEKFVEDIWKQNPYDVKIIDNKVANSNIESEITLEDLDSSNFAVVPFLTQYTIKSNLNLTPYQQEFASQTYKKLYINEKNKILNDN